MDPITIRRVRALREGSHVKRCHTVPHFGEYTVGKHSFDALNLLLLMHRNPSIELIKAVAWHDMGERFVGDVPFTALAADEKFKKIYQQLETEFLEGQEIKIPILSEDDKLWLSAVDKLELYLWAEEQMMMGNKNVQHFITNLKLWFKENKLPARIRHFLDLWEWERIKL